MSAKGRENSGLLSNILLVHVGKVQKQHMSDCFVALPSFIEEALGACVKIMWRKKAVSPDEQPSSKR